MGLCEETSRHIVVQKRFLQVSLRYLRKDVAFDEMDREKR
jgi:hypothetical protein